MVQLYVKATNRSTGEIIYEGLKRSYFNYNEALEDMRKLLANERAPITSFRLPCEYLWSLRGESCYISCHHGNCRTTIYLK